MPMPAQIPGSRTETSAATQQFLKALSAPPTAADTDAAFTAALEPKSEGRAVINGKDGHSFEVYANSDYRSLTWRRPVEFPAVLLGPVTAEARLAFLKAAAENKDMFGQSFPKDEIQAIRATLARAQEGMDIDSAFYLERYLIREETRRQGTGGAQLPSSEVVEVERHGSGFQVRFGSAMEVLGSDETYRFTRKGKPVGAQDRHQTNAPSPIDVFVRAHPTKTDRMIWTPNGEGQFQENTHVDFSFEGRGRDRADMGSGFQEGVAGLMLALGLKTEAVRDALSAMDEEKRGLQTQMWSAPDFSSLSVPRMPAVDPAERDRLRAELEGSDSAD